MTREQVIATVAEIILRDHRRGDQVLLAKVRERFGHTAEAYIAEFHLGTCLFMLEELEKVEPGRGYDALRSVRDANRRLVATH